MSGWSERIYRGLLRLLPRGFRERHEDELVEAFGHRLEAAGSHGVPATALCWLRGVTDLIGAAARERLRRLDRDVDGGLTTGLGVNMMGGRLWRDLMYSGRSLARQPLFVLVAAASIAIGIAANTAVFSVANTLLLRPLPGIPNYDRVVEVGRTSQGDGFDTFAYPELRDLREGVPSLDQVAAYSVEIFSVGSEGEGVRTGGLSVSPEYFDILGVRPAQGRLFSPEEAVGVGEHPVVVISHGVWRDMMGSSSAAIGSTLRVNRIPHTVVGILPEEFGGHMIGPRNDIYLPITQAPILRETPGLLESRNSSWHMVLGEPAEGATLEVVNRELAALGERLAERHPDLNAGRGYRAVALTPVPGGGQAAVRIFMTVLLGMVGVILLVTCLNVAGMFLSRATARDREMAVRVALGAGRGDIVRQLTIEALLVFTLGGGVGVALGTWLTGLVRPDVLAVPFPLALRIVPDIRVLSLAVGVTLVCGLAFGLLPALRATRTRLAGVLRDDDRSGSRGAGRLRSIFATGQVALSLVLLVAAGLFSRSLQQVATADLGFEAEDRWVTYLDLGLEGYDEAAGQVLYDEVLTSLRGQGWVQAATVASDLPLDLASRGTAVTPVGWESSESQPYLATDFNEISDGYFEALGIRIMEGRDFTPTDQSGSAAVAVVSRAFAEAAWPGEHALGQRFYAAAGAFGPEIEVVGVVADVQNQMITDAAGPFAYFPLTQAYNADLRILVHSTLQPSELVPRLRQSILGVDGSLALSEVMSLERITGMGVLPQRIAALLTTTLALVALLLSGMGIYGVVSYAVSRQRREIGIRLALGADGPGVVRRYLRGGVLLALPGLVLGGLASIVVAGLLRSMLLDLSPYDPLALGGVAALLLMVVVAATWIPARRASLVDPAESLRAD